MMIGPVHASTEDRSRANVRCSLRWNFSGSSNSSGFFFVRCFCFLFVQDRAASVKNSSWARRSRAASRRFIFRLIRAGLGRPRARRKFTFFSLWWWCAESHIPHTPGLQSKQIRGYARFVFARWIWGFPWMKESLLIWQPYRSSIDLCLFVVEQLRLTFKRSFDRYRFKSLVLLSTIRFESNNKLFVILKAFSIFMVLIIRHGSIDYIYAYFDIFIILW